MGPIKTMYIAVLIFKQDKLKIYTSVQNSFQEQTRYSISFLISVRLVSVCQSIIFTFVVLQIWWSKS